MQKLPLGAIADRPRVGRAIVAYASPIAVFAALTLIEPQLPTAQYPPFYLLKMLAVTGVLLLFPQPLADLRPFEHAPATRCRSRSRRRGRVGARGNDGFLSVLVECK
jgi:hypothetical protein